MPPSQPSTLLRNSLPHFEGKTLSGNRVDTSSFHGRPLVVSFFSDHCGACKRSLLATQATYSEEHDVTVVGVFDGDTSQALRLTKEYDLKFPVFVDKGHEIAKSFQVDEMPRTFVADPGGWVRWVGGADLTEDLLTVALDKVR